MSEIHTIELCLTTILSQLHRIFRSWIIRNQWGFSFSKRLPGIGARINFNTCVEVIKKSRELRLAFNSPSPSF